MDYNTKIASLTMLNIEAVVKAAEVASNRAHHGSTCNGFLGYMVNKDGDRINYHDIPMGESHLWWQAFDESQCSCGLGALRRVLWERKLSETYCKKEIKRIEGYGATTHPNANVDSLKAEVDALRSEVIAIREESEKVRDENFKLRRKLNTVQAASKV